MVTMVATRLLWNHFDHRYLRSRKTTRESVTEFGTDWKGVVVIKNHLE